MFIERRNAARRKINRLAQFYSRDGSAMPRNCVVTDISDSGARLYADVETPPVFVLSVSGDGINLRRECRVVWRIGGELGVTFIGKTNGQR